MKLLSELNNSFIVNEGAIHTQHIMCNKETKRNYPNT